MKIIFHIGMGKTGTSSIQLALQQNAETLAAHKAKYLGMWFDLIDPKFTGYQGQAQFFAAPPDEMSGMADIFHSQLVKLAEQENLESFVFSNEVLFGHVAHFTPFLRRLREVMDVRLVAYIRDPYAWLPSAFTQWGIRHKQNHGPVQPYPQRARHLIGQYEGIRTWIANFRGSLVVRPFDRAVDAVQDFASAIGVPLVTQGKRVLERAEPAEILLRAIYNSRFDGPVLPDQFDRVVLDIDQKPALDSREMARLCFVHDGTAAIIEEKRELFEFIRNETGIDYLSAEAEPQTEVDPAELQRRFIDHLAAIVLDQAERVTRLEAQIARLSTR